MIEIPVIFGDCDHLMGVFNSPGPDGETLPSTTAVIMVTAGVLPHSGPFRLHVELARRLSAIGIPSFRFDLSGIGESLSYGTGGCSMDRAASEVSAAIDFLSATHGIERVILFGLCSGADDSVHAALHDRRVAGLVAMDGCGYRTPRFYWHHLTGYVLPRIVCRRRWRQKIAALLGRKSSTDRFASIPVGDDLREFPDRDTAITQFQTLVDGGVRMHFLYTGGVREYYNHAGQFWSMLPDANWRGLATTTMLPAMDHVAMLREDRDELIDHLCQTIGTMLGELTPTQRSTGKPSRLASAT